MAPSDMGKTPMGMLRSSAKVVILRASPSGPKSSRILTVSLPLRPAGAGNGYSTDSVTHSRPMASKAMLTGFLTFGSLATSCTMNPGGTCSPFNSSSAVRGSVGAISGGGACPAPRPVTRTMPMAPNTGNRERMVSPEKSSRMIFLLTTRINPGVLLSQGVHG